MIPIFPYSVLHICGFLCVVPCAWNTFLSLLYLENSSSFMTHINCHLLSEVFPDFLKAVPDTVFPWCFVSSLQYLSHLLIISLYLCSHYWLFIIVNSVLYVLNELALSSLFWRRTSSWITLYMKCSFYIFFQPFVSLCFWPVDFSLS